MESIIPIIVVIYLISSVVEAVRKSINTPQEQKTQSPDPSSLKPVAEPTVIEPQVIESQPIETIILDDQVQESPFESKKSDDHYDLEIPRTSFYDDLDENEDEDEAEFRSTLRRDKETERIVHPAIQDQKNLNDKMREVVVLSEALREPRAIRPWPNR